MKSRYDILISELCEEIDILRERGMQAEEDAEYWRDQYSKLLNDSLKRSNEMTGIILKSCLTE